MASLEHRNPVGPARMAELLAAGESLSQWTKSAVVGGGGGGSDGAGSDVGRELVARTVAAGLGVSERACNSAYTM